MLSNRWRCSLQFISARWVELCASFSSRNYMCSARYRTRKIRIYFVCGFRKRRKNVWKKGASLKVKRFVWFNDVPSGTEPLSSSNTFPKNTFSKLLNISLWLARWIQNKSKHVAREREKANGKKEKYWFYFNNKWTLKRRHEQSKMI